MRSANDDGIARWKDLGLDAFRSHAPVDANQSPLFLARKRNNFEVRPRGKYRVIRARAHLDNPSPLACR
jgi:hypothetical protein